MKNFLLLFLFISIFSSKAQKVDLDRFYFNVSYQVLPNEPVPFEERTYTSQVQLGSAIQVYADPTLINEKITINGWKKEDVKPTVNIDLTIQDFVDKEVVTKTRVDEKKDKEGKIISRTVYHYVVANYSGKSFAKIKGPITPKPLTEKEIEEEKSKKEAVASNRFLKNAVVKTDSTVVQNGYNLNLNDGLEYKSSESTDPSIPLKDFRLNKSRIHDDMLRKYVDNTVNNLVYNVNKKYGYSPKYDREIIWILDAKSEEGVTQIEATQAVSSLFGTMKPNESIAELKSNMVPLIEYFESLKTKYPEDNKASRKMRYSAYYNLGVIYLMLDEPEKTIIEGEKLIANDYDKGDGKDLIERANKLINSFKIAKTNSTHNPVRN